MTKQQIKTAVDLIKGDTYGLLIRLSVIKKQAIQCKALSQFQIFLIEEMEQEMNETARKLSLNSRYL